ncbi:MAG: hypothetical protein EXR51_10580, partial [Dehalococcoidia bacterium]|nr:hypothetical protein [Dehalococcoidia bacterium]
MAHQRRGGDQSVEAAQFPPLPPVSLPKLDAQRCYPAVNPDVIHRLQQRRRARLFVGARTAEHFE